MKDCFVDIENKPNDCLILNPLIVQETVSKPSCYDDNLDIEEQLNELKNSLLNSLESVKDFLEGAIRSNTEGINSEIKRAQSEENFIKDRALDIETIHTSIDKNKFTIGGRSIDTNTVFLEEIPSATIEKAGLMSASDKLKLDSLTEGNENIAAIEGLSQLITHEQERAISEENSIKKDALLYSTVHTTVYPDKVSLEGKTIDGTNTMVVDLPLATAEKSGLMSPDVFNLVYANSLEIANEASSRISSDRDIKNKAALFGMFASRATEDTFSINYSSIDNTEGSFSLPIVTTEASGIMSAADKQQLDSNTKALNKASLIHQDLDTRVGILEKQSPEELVQTEKDRAEAVEQGLTNAITQLNLTIVNYNLLAKTSEVADKSTVINYLLNAGKLSKGMVVMYYTSDGWKQMCYNSMVETPTAFLNESNWKDLNIEQDKITDMETTLTTLSKLFLRTPTANLGYEDIGTQIFNGGKPYWWDGTQWVDATGTKAPW